MQLLYALRRGIYYPSQKNNFGEMPPRADRERYLKKVRTMGFDAIEIPASTTEGSNESDARELRKEVEAFGLKLGCVRGGGPITHPRSGKEVLGRLLDTVRFASWVGASVVNVTCVMPPVEAHGRGALHQGERVSQGSSRVTPESDYVLSADRFREVGKLAGDNGLNVSIEVHQGSLADNSWSALHLIDLIDLPNFGVNPDLGNIYWQYDESEETCEAAIVALAPRATYWHCKNLVKVPVPELQKAIYLRVPLPDGEIDYRFAISAMVEANYGGYLAVEGAREGDQLTLDSRSADYAMAILRELGQ